MAQNKDVSIGLERVLLHKSPVKSFTLGSVLHIIMF